MLCLLQTQCVVSLSHFDAVIVTGTQCLVRIAREEMFPQARNPYSHSPRQALNPDWKQQAFDTDWIQLVYGRDWIQLICVRLDTAGL